jgi:hypothetical protein
MNTDAGRNYFARERMMIERGDVEIEVEDGHFDPYFGQFAAARTATVSWFHQHLRQDQ